MTTMQGFEPGEAWFYSHPDGQFYESDLSSRRPSIIQ